MYITIFFVKIGTEAAKGVLENAKKMCLQRWDVTNESRMIVEEAWVGKGEMQPRFD